MNIRSALNTNTRKAIVAGTIVATAMTFGLSGTAAATPYANNDSNNRYWNNQGRHNNNRNTCYDAFWVYNRHEDRWFRVGYNERTDRWEVCRRNYDYNQNRWSGNDKHNDRNDERDERYWERQGRRENDNHRWSNNGRRDY